MKRKTIIETIVFLFILLFAYAAINKLMDYENFKSQLGKSPLITQFATVLSWAVPIVEIVIALTLPIQQLRLTALYSSFALMLIFTLYIAFILSFSPYIPCSCGGILETMGWTQHLVFNIFFTSLAILGIMIYPRTHINPDRAKDHDTIGDQTVSHQINKIALK
jgi:uncharacterized membrane protein YphA (DoxX/SURF4 family)